MEEYTSRFENFKFMHAEIKKFNAEGKTVHAHNNFSDMSRAEYQAKPCYISAPKDLSAPVHDVNSVPNAPASVDWVSAGYVNEIKNQGRCGSCWAFSATSAVESSYAIAKKSRKYLYNLSEQQMVSCSTKNFGCDGGSYQTAWDYLKSSP
jgi:C1A family cysteine protease